MALSFCSNWGSSSGGGTTTASTVHQHLHHQDNTRFSFSQTQPDQLASHFFGLDYNLSLPDTCIDSLFDTNTNNDDYSENYYITDYYLPNFHTLPSPENINFLPNQTQISPLDHYHEFEPYSYFPKRQKSCENHYDQMDTIPLFFNGYIPLPDVLPTTQASPPVLQEASVSVPSHGYVGGSTNTSMKKTTSGVLSAQSIAARERRRKITEKTQELGKLIPGGNKMNTAEMFHSASNYVKFLQAQVSLLQFMGFIQETKEEEVELRKHKDLKFYKQTQGLEILTSQTIQEKLYTEEKCLVPIEFVQVLANDPEIQSRPFFKDINQLLMQNQGEIQK